MELGSEVCSARSPCCTDCPVATLCRANRQGRQQEIPVRKKKRPHESVREAAVLVRRRGRVLLLRWPEGRRWAGLWDFPRFPIEAEHLAAIHSELVENVRALAGAMIAPGRHVTTLRHGVTRFRITLECYEADYVSQDKKANATLETRWLRLAELRDYPLSSTGRKLANLVQKKTK
jgi:A/G-specific adenine glycosylase